MLTLKNGTLYPIKNISVVDQSQIMLSLTKFIENNINIFCLKIVSLNSL
jgi:hypothetical protein